MGATESTLISRVYRDAWQMTQFQVSTEFRSAPTTAPNVGGAVECQRGSKGFRKSGKGRCNLARTFYLDHQIFAKEDNWPIIRCVLDNQASVRLVCSQWNLVEVAFASDEWQRTRRANFIDSLNPLWIMNGRDIQRAEVHRFVWARCFRASIQPEVCAIVADLALTLAPACMVFPGSLSAAEFVAGEWASVRDAVSPTPEVLRKLQAAGRQNLPSIEACRSWIDPLIPLSDDDGRLLSQQSHREILDFCIKNWPELIASCPALAAESRLFEARTRDPLRKPEVNDAADLQHAFTALAYCNHFVTEDHYLFRCAEKTSAASSSFARPHRSLADLISVFSENN